MIQNLLSVGLYVLAFDQIWAFCGTHFDYVGFQTPEIIWSKFIWVLLMIIIPVLFYKEHLSVSNFLAVNFFAFVYVSVQMGLYYQHIATGDNRVVPHMLFLFCAMITYFLVNRIQFKRRRCPNDQETSTPASFHQWEPSIFVLFLLSLVFCSIVLFFFRNALSFSSLAEASSSRAYQNTVLEQAPSIIGYLMTWLSSFLLPLIFSYGIYSQRIRYVIAAVLGFVALYCCTAMKTDILVPLFMIFFIMILRFSDKYSLLSLLLTCLSIFSFLFLALPSSVQIFFLLQALLFERTLANPGFLFSEYFLFFEQNPPTYFSHVNIVRLLGVQYPYGALAVGQVVHGGDSNSCAAFPAYDGIAAAHLTGLLIILIIFLLFLIFFKFLTDRYIEKKEDRFLICVALVPSTIALLNSSLFTYLLSRGVFFMILFIVFNGTRNPSKSPELDCQ